MNTSATHVQNSNLMNNKSYSRKIECNLSSERAVFQQMLF